MGAMLEGRSAIVTGAASGVGRAVAMRFAEQGARLLLTDSDETALAETVDTLEREGADVTSWACDLREKLGVKNLIASAADRFERIDILVNASLIVAMGDPFEVEAEEFDKAYQNNVRSVFLLSQAVAARMIALRDSDEDESAPHGSIVNITSIAARRTVPELLPYSVSCAALDQLTRSMAVALAPRGVRVNGVALGAVMTRGLRDALRDRKDLRGEIIDTTPMRRIGEPTEAADAAAYLASERASFITGQILAVDGGRTVLDPLAAPNR